MSGLVQCNTCLAVVFRSTLWNLGCCPLCIRTSSLYGEISRLQSLVCTLQTEVERLSMPRAVMQPSVQPPLPQRPPRRRAVWTTVGSGRLRAVENRHRNFGLSVSNSYNVLADLNNEVVADISEAPQLEDEGMFQGEVVVSEVHSVTKPSGAVSGNKKRMHFLVGDSTVRGVDLGQSKDVVKLMRCLPGATASRDRRRITNIVKAVSKVNNVDVVVHLGTNDLSQRNVDLVKRDFQCLSVELGKITNSVTFSEVLPVCGQEDKTTCITEFNVWLRQWCKAEGFGYVSHDVNRWSNRELFKRDGLHPSYRGTQVLGEDFRTFLDRHLN